MKLFLRSKKVHIFTISVIGILISLVGCSQQASSTPGATPSSAAIQTRTITDDLDRKVEVPAQPQRVLALSRNFMDELYELGIISIGKVEEYNNRAELNALPSVSNQSTPNLEAIYKLKPDLILANSRQHAQMLEGLVASGAAVVFIDPSKVKNDPLTDRILFIAEVTNRQTEAQAYVKRLLDLCRELQGKIAPAGYKTGLFLQSADGAKSAQPTGFFGLMLGRLGIENIVPTGLPGGEKETWVAFSTETILQKNPDIILLKSSSNDKTENETILNSFLQNTAWKGLKAVKNKKVFVIPAKINSGSISNEDAFKTTAKIIYPEGFK